MLIVKTTQRLTRFVLPQAIPVLLVACAAILPAQDLAPRAYVITPLRANAINLTWSFYDGGLNFGGTIPITGAKGTYGISVFSYYNSLSFFGRSANVTVALPYAAGTFSGEVLGTTRSVYRSGLMDFSARFSVNLIGGPAMEASDFVKWQQKRILGVSFKMIAPTGQYDGRRLINWGINRWAFKPEIGYSQRWGGWVLDGYAGLWLYTTNDAFYEIPIHRSQTQEPIGSLEGHLSHDFGKRRLWASLDGNFWWGGLTALNGVQNPASRQTSSRIGGTVSIPFTRHQSIKIAYSGGTYVRYGGNYENLQVSWQYSWIGTRR